MHEWSLRTHVLPSLGHLKLDSIRRPRLVEWVERLDFEHEPSTVNNAANPLRVIFARAVDQELIEFNPMAQLARKARAG